MYVYTLAGKEGASVIQEDKKERGRNKSLILFQDRTQVLRVKLSGKIIIFHIKQEMDLAHLHLLPLNPSSSVIPIYVILSPSNTLMLTSAIVSKKLISDLS